MSVYSQALLLYLSLVMVIGCRSEPTGESVHGRVTIAGEPMLEGLITFQPIEETTGPKISTMIENGEYSVSPSEGIHAGLFRVEILGMPPGVKAMASGEHQPQLVPRGPTLYREVAAEFNFHSQLRAVLRSGVDNRLDFQVKLGDHP